MISTKQYITAIEILKKEYPKWNAPIVTFIAIQTKDPFRILISTILSLRTKDQVTSEAAKRLFEQADTPAIMLTLSAEKLAQLIYPVGFYKTKANQILVICALIIEKHKGLVPDSLEELLKFKGVGRKTANLVLAQGFQKDAICVDTHVHRISNRLGYVKTKTPEETEFALMKKLPKSYWSQINDLLVAFGQTICNPVKPKCHKCLIEFCPSRKA
jgi:endonuclease III